jgi:2-polyprenyl-3-methyl-5-hydroxy-6-metoxy-1,4-benzoquinol methylase
MSVVHYTNCPVCGSNSVQPVLSAQDHTVSGESFPIWQCRDCSLRFTQDVPDESSIGKYYRSENYISHTDTSKGLVNRIYKKVRKQTLKNKRRLVNKITGRGKGSLLDIGSGVGAFVNEMQMHGWNVTGLEPDEKAREIAKKNFHSDLKETTELFKLRPKSFDVITLWHVLEHVHRLHPYIEQIKSLLAESGILIIAVPNYESGDAKVYKENWAAYDVPRHLYHFSPLSMETLMKAHGLKIIEWRPMWYDSFYISILSSKYKKGKTNWVGAAWNGLRSNLKAMVNKKKCSSVIYIIAKK